MTTTDWKCIVCSQTHSSTVRDGGGIVTLNLSKWPFYYFFLCACMWDSIGVTTLKVNVGARTSLYSSQHFPALPLGYWSCALHVLWGCFAIMCTVSPKRFCYLQCSASSVTRVFAAVTVSTIAHLTIESAVVAEVLYWGTQRPTFNSHIQFTFNLKMPVCRDLGTCLQSRDGQN